MYHKHVHDRVSTCYRLPLAMLPMTRRRRKPTRAQDALRTSTTMATHKTPNSVFLSPTFLMPCPPHMMEK